MNWKISLSNLELYAKKSIWLPLRGHSPARRSFNLNFASKWSTLATCFIRSTSQMLQHVASCVLFLQHKSTYYIEVGAKHLRVHLTNQNQFHILFLHRKERIRQSSVVQELVGIVMDATLLCLFKAHRKYRGMKNCLLF